MDEIENSEQKPKLCRLAILSPLLLFFFWLLLIISSLVFKNLPDQIFLLIFIIIIFVSILFGILALYKIHKSKGGLSGRFSAMLGITVALFFIISIVFPCEYRPPEGTAQRVICANRLKKLSMALNNYSKENGGKYPAPDKWCDMIKSKITEQDFICPSSKAKKCSYAINPNCEPNSSDDIVLLFETGDGWNQFGGPEMLIPVHKKSCNVLFNDGHVEKIWPDKIGKLKWKAE
jgi:prepilin-type processing-associated H-X9-DG protein